MTLATRAVLAYLHSCAVWAISRYKHLDRGLKSVLFFNQSALILNLRPTAAKEYLALF